MTIRTLSFKPIPFTNSHHIQTVIGSCGLSTNLMPTSQIIIPLPDGDKLCCEISTPSQWKTCDPTVLMIHGLGGSHRSLYLQRLVPKLLEMNHRVIRVNLRGCGTGEHLARLTYHGGVSDDILHVLNKIKQMTPLSPITLLGFSLGGNIILKLIGELGSDAEQYISQALLVCPAVDLFDSAQRIDLPQNRFYQKYYLKMLQTQVQRRYHMFSDLPKINIKEAKRLMDFDEKYTSVIWNFSSALDYYDKCSSSKLVANIKVPCNILYAEDDPVVNPQTIESADWPKNVNLWRTTRGGHMGFVGYVGGGYGFRWMDYQVIKFIRSFQ